MDQPTQFPNVFADVELCHVRTAGRESGRPHANPMWFCVYEGTIYLVSEEGNDADWIRNASNHPHVIVTIGDEVRRGWARPVRDPEERHLVGLAMGAKYGGSREVADSGVSDQDFLWSLPAIAVASWRERPNQPSAWWQATLAEEAG